MTVTLPTATHQTDHRLGQADRSCSTAAPKSGRARFASQFPEAIFFECEPGLNHLEVFKVPTYTWDDFLAACKLVAKGNHRSRRS